jgi:hypothetical protein
MRRSHAPVLAVLIALVFSCGGGGGQPPPPAGSCKTGGTATGSYAAPCNQCALESCNDELVAKAGSGWASQYFGGDGACQAFNGCLCQCLDAAGNPATCALSPACLAMVDAPCLAALQAAQQCLAQRCRETCR